MITYLVVLVVWRGRFALVDPRVQHGPPDEPAARRSTGRAWSRRVIATVACCSSCSRRSLPRTEGVLLVAGALLISRKLSTRRILGLVDWHLLVLFAALFVVTHAFDVTGLPAQLVAALESRGVAADQTPGCWGR